MATITGTTGNDTLNGDTTLAGTFNDSIVGLVGNDLINGLAGNDTLIGDAGNDRIFGGVGNDSIFGGADNDSIVGDAGSDSLSGGLGNDSIVGGADFDYADYSAVAAAITANLGTGAATGEGTDSLNGIEGIIGGSGGDSLTGDGAANYFAGNGGADSISGAAGADSIFGGTGSDTLRGGDDADAVFGGADADSIFGDAGADSLFGGDGNDSMDGGAGNDLLEGGLGIDRIDGAGGTDTASYAGSTGAVNVSINGATGNTGGDATGDVLSNIENLIGSGLNDTLTGSGAANVIEGGAGGDTINGAGGNDTASYDGSNAAVNVVVNGAASGGHAQGDVLSNLENLIGSDFNDTLGGDAAANILTGGYGNDSLTGAAGADSLLGGFGNDTLIGGADGDSIVGGVGIDTASYVGSTAGVNVVINGAVSGGHAAGDTMSGIENLIGSGLNDTLSGDGVNNTIEGGGGADSINGQGGTDTASYASAGAGVAITIGATGTAGDATGDTLTNIENLIGSGSNDTLGGNASNNTIEGGGGADSINGFGGTDTASYASATSGVAITIGSTGTAGAATGDTLTNIENLTGSSFNDTLGGNAGNNTVSGGAGDDVLSGGDNADLLVGSFGSDTADYSGSNAAVNVSLLNTGAQGGGHAQGDTLSGINNLTGSSGADTLIGDGTDNVISGGGGNDTITGNLGADSIDGGTGDDVITAGPTVEGTASTAQNLTFDWLGGGRADETNMTSSFTDTIGGMTVQVDYVQGAGNAYRVEAMPNSGAGDAFPDGGVGMYTANGAVNGDSAAYLQRSGAGETTEVSFTFGSVDPTVQSDQVTNVAFTISDIDQINYTDNVTIFAYDEFGNSIPVTVTAGSSSEMSVTTLTGGEVDVVATGDGGQPTDASTGVLVQIPGPVARIVIRYSDLANSTQYILMSDISFTTIPPAVDVDNDTVSGGAGNDIILGGIGQDSLSGGGDRDRIDGEAGNDTIAGDAGNDSLAGGAGNDLLSGSTEDDSLVGGTGDDTLDGGADSDSLAGGDGNDSLVGDSGADTLDGGANNDRIFGGTGTDSLIGGSGNDLLDGGSENDTLEGGIGNDTVIGDVGNDTFIIGDGDVETVTGDNVATVPGYEFVFGGGGGVNAANDFDVLDLSEYGFARTEIVRLSNDPGNDAYEDGYVIILDTLGNEIGRIDFDNIEKIVPCFTPGTLILTDRGERPVESLTAGDLVMTRDHGLQPLRWVGQRHLSYVDLLAQPEMRPVQIAAGGFDGFGPDRTMLVSPQHRLLVETAQAELLFGEAEVLVAAKHLLGHAAITSVLPAEGVSYIHILFDRHEIVKSDGLWTESFQPAERTLSAMDADVRAEVLTLFPALADATGVMAAARPSLKAHEAKVLFAL